MERSTKLTALQGQSLFENMKPEALAPILDFCKVRTFSKGETLWREGAPALNFTFLVKGKIKIVKIRQDGGEATLGVFDEGDAVGQVAVFRRMPYPASAVAIDEGFCIEIFRDHFYGTLQKHESLLEGMLEGIMARNFDLVRRVEELTTSSAEQRLGMLFTGLCDKHGKRTQLPNGGMGIHLDINLSRKDIADMINVRVETAIRLMSRWNKVGPVSTLADGFMVVDCDWLQSLADGE